MADARDPAEGWSWFAPPTPVADRDEVALVDLAPAFARCFAGADGARALAALKAMTLDRALGPDTPEPALRHLEGQRHLVATILALVARGRGARSP